MKKILLAFILANPLLSFTQQLDTQADLAKARQTASANNKMIALVVEATACDDCNSTAAKSFEQGALRKYLADSFVVLHIGADHADRELLKEFYNYGDGHVVLFLDKQGTLVHRMNRSSTRYQEYIEEGKKALLNQTTGENLRALEKAGLDNQLSNDELYELISSRKKMGLPTDHLLEVYVSKLSTDSLSSPTTLQRIAQACPILRSAADKALRNNFDLFNQAWYKLPLPERQSINQQIISKTRMLAIRQQDLNLALQVANFSRSINNDPKTGQRSFTYNMMEYYRGVADTGRFLNQADLFYENYYMTLLPETIKQKDSLQQVALLQRTPGDTLQRRGTNFVVRKTISTSTMGQSVCQAITAGARNVYNMKPDTMYLRKALAWVIHANRFFESPETKDLWARLVQQLDNNTAQAIELEQQAIAIQEKRGLNARKYVQALEQLKAARP